MKKLNIILFIILLLSIVSVSALADVYTDIIDDPQYDGYESELKEILDDINSKPLEYASYISPGSSDIEDILSSEYVKFYPVYIYKGEITKDAVSDFADGISDEHYWIISNDKYETVFVTGRSETIVERDGGKWTLGSQTSNIIYPDDSGEPLDVDFTPSGLETLLKDEFDEIKLIQITGSLRAGTYVYAKDDSGEYLMPFVSRPDLMNMENGKLYTVSELFDILVASEEEFNKTFASSGKDVIASGGGGVIADDVMAGTPGDPVNTDIHTQTYLLIAAIVVGLILAVVACCLIVKIRKLKK